MVSDQVETHPVALANTADAPFFSVSVLKLTVLSFCSLGLYQLYWFYMNWRIISDRTGDKMIPFLRAIFPVFFCHSLFVEIRDYGERKEMAPTFAAGWLALGWIAASMAWRLPDPYALVGFFAVFFLVPVQAFVNQVNATCAPEADRNDKFSGWNWVLLVVGSIALLLSVVGSFLPDDLK